MRSAFDLSETYSLLIFLRARRVPTIPLISKILIFPLSPWIWAEHSFEFIIICDAIAGTLITPFYYTSFPCIFQGNWIENIFHVFVDPPPSAQWNRQQYIVMSTSLPHLNRPKRSSVRFQIFENPFRSHPNWCNVMIRNDIYRYVETLSTREINEWFLLNTFLKRKMEIHSQRTLIPSRDERVRCGMARTIHGESQKHSSTVLHRSPSAECETLKWTELKMCFPFDSSRSDHQLCECGECQWSQISPSPLRSAWTIHINANENDRMKSVCWHTQDTVEVDALTSFSVGAHFSGRFSRRIAYKWVLALLLISLCLSIHPTLHSERARAHAVTRNLFSFLSHSESVFSRKILFDFLSLV